MTREQKFVKLGIAYRAMGLDLYEESAALALEAMERAGLVCIPATADDEEVRRVAETIKRADGDLAVSWNYVARAACASVREGT